MLFNCYNDALMSLLCASVTVLGPQGLLSCEELFAPTLNGLSLLTFISFVYALNHYSISFLDSVSFPNISSLPHLPLFRCATQNLLLAENPEHQGFSVGKFLSEDILLSMRTMTF